MVDHIELGARGEDEAVSMLLSKGYKIVARNWRYKHFEIDIIAEDNVSVVFVEVKTRSQTYGGREPYQAVNYMKQKNLLRAINAYIKLKKITKQPRFDIISLLIVDNFVVSAEHFEDVLTPFDMARKPLSFHWGRRK